MKFARPLIGETFNDRLIATGGRPAGFDYLRISLAIGVIFFHSFDLTSGYNVAFHRYFGLFRPFDAIILPMFFSLSGFLVAGSLERSKTLISFLGLRIIRLVPALFVETALCAIVIGSIFTTLSRSEYFSSQMFYRYFLNIVGDIHFNLPGVFANNIYPNTVNGQLWTIPWELKCYALIAMISIFGFIRNRYLFFSLVVGLNLFYFIYHDFFGPDHLNSHVGDTSVSGSLLVISFLYGISLYLLRLSIVWNKWVFIIAIPLLYTLLSLPVAFWGDPLAALPAAYMTIYLGLLEPRRLKIVSSGDYSYGIYLYGFPIQQALIALSGQSGQGWYVNFVLSVAIAGVIAFFSWHAVEKHAANLRPKLFRLEEFILALLTNRFKFLSSAFNGR